MVASWVQQLQDVVDRLSPFACRIGDRDYFGPLDALEKAAETVGESWSRSQLDYQAMVYYKDFSVPPAGARFSIEWGFHRTFSDGGTVGEWKIYTGEDVNERIVTLSGGVDIIQYDEDFRSARQEFEESKEEIGSILTAFLAAQDDEYLAQLRTKVEEQKVFSRDSVLKSTIATGAVATRDPQANARIQSAPHQGVLAAIWAIRSAFDACNELSKIADRAARHIDRMSSPQTRVTQQIGTNVFIGHGRSLLWHQLKDFIQDRLQLPVDEFNRVPIAGITNIDRLSRMLDEAAVAFLVLTAEDERVDGTMTARLNVVHEVGLFQGRLGFGRAIVMLEEGCEGFSNIEGLGQIRFPAGNIAASFENVRQLLEREQLIGDIE